MWRSEENHNATYNKFSKCAIQWLARMVDSNPLSNHRIPAPEWILDAGRMVRRLKYRKSEYLSHGSQDGGGMRKGFNLLDRLENETWSPGWKTP